MADTMQFDLVSPEARIVSGKAASVQIPGAEGTLTAMPGHAPVITTLRPGILRAEMDGEVEAQLEEARAKAASAPAEERDAVELLVADLVELVQAMASDRSLQGSSGAPAPA